MLYVLTVLCMYHSRLSAKFMKQAKNRNSLLISALFQKQSE
jgi:hypothetical protein